LETSGANVSVQDFEVTDAQKWKITYITDGYYEISDLSGTMVLTAGGNTVGSGVSMQTRGNTLGTNQQWFISAGGGGYRFAPRSAYYQQYGLDRYHVCIGVGNTGSASNVQMMTHTTQLTSERMWNLEECGNVVNVNVWYDHAYVTRYGNTVDSTNTAANNAVRTRIVGHMEALQQKFWTEFGIFVNYTMPQRISCYACNYCTRMHNQQCDHYDDGECKGVLAYGKLDGTDGLHTNIDTISSDLVSGTYDYTDNPSARPEGFEDREAFTSNDKTIDMVFIGHDFCRHKGTVNHADHSTDNNVCGLAYHLNSPTDTINEELITIHNFDPLPYHGGGIALDNLTYERESVIHEFGHMFGTEDDYYENDDDYHDNARQIKCIYSQKTRFVEAVEDEFYMCEDCVDIITSNAFMYNSLP
jgi:hypothetical protein